jgi:hypothetical protein
MPEQDRSLNRKAISKQDDRLNGRKAVSEQGVLRESRVIALFLNSALEGGEGSASRPSRTLPPGKNRTHCTRGRVGLRAGLNMCEKSRPHRDSIPGPSSP